MKPFCPLPPRLFRPPEPVQTDSRSGWRFQILGAGGGRCLRGRGLPRVADRPGLSDPHPGRPVGGLRGHRPGGRPLQIRPPRRPRQSPLLRRPHRLRGGAPAGDGRATVGPLRLPLAGRPLAVLPAADERLTPYPALSAGSDSTAAGRLPRPGAHPETAGLHRRGVLVGTGTAHGLLRPLCWVAAGGADALGGRLSPGGAERVLGLERHRLFRSLRPVPGHGGLPQPVGLEPSSPAPLFAGLRPILAGHLPPGRPAGRHRRPPVLLPRTGRTQVPVPAGGGVSGRGVYSCGRPFPWGTAWDRQSSPPSPWPTCFCTRPGSAQTA